MIILNGKEKLEAEKFIREAAAQARKATCLRRKCGTVIVKYNLIIGSGYNSPPGNDEKQRRCTLEKNTFNNKVTDKTCCMHAEHRAIADALKGDPDKLKGSRLYFASVNKEGNILLSEEPYCTLCSKFALDIGIKEFVLQKEEGICVYQTSEYNNVSYSYGK